MPRRESGRRLDRSSRNPDLKWHVSRLLDRRIPDFRDICDLDGRSVLLPRDMRYYPRQDALHWRVERLA